MFNDFCFYVSKGLEITKYSFICISFREVHTFTYVFIHPTIVSIRDVKAYSSFYLICNIFFIYWTEHGTYKLIKNARPSSMLRLSVQSHILNFIKSSKTLNGNTKINQWKMFCRIVDMYIVHTTPLISIGT